MVTPVDNRTPVIIVQHPRERQHPFGTVRLARLGLRNVAVHVASRETGEEGGARCPPCVPPKTALLYPSPDATPIDEVSDLGGLLVLDGTWPSSRTLLRANPWMTELPKVTLRPTRPGRYRIRKAPRPEVQLSTIEAIVAALTQVEPETPGLPGLLQAFDAMIDHQIELQARYGRPLEPRR